MQQDHHVTRRDYANHKAEFERVMANGNFGHPDNYYQWKDKERKLAAKLSDKNERTFDPMHYWYGGLGS